MEELTTELRARQRARYLVGLIWHLGTFTIINGFFWILDWSIGQAGVQWAPWITAVWGLALAFHVLAYLVDGRGVERRLTEGYVRREREQLSH